VGGEPAEGARVLVPAGANWLGAAAARVAPVAVLLPAGVGPSIVGVAGEHVPSKDWCGAAKRFCLLADLRVVGVAAATPKAIPIVICLQPVCQLGCCRACWSAHVVCASGAGCACNWWDSLQEQALRLDGDRF
jgi:hypothetical protein